MKRTLTAGVCVVAALALAAGVAPAQKKPDIVGTWLGYALTGDGSRVELTVVFDKGEAGYTGKMTEATGMIPESVLRQIVLKDGKLTFEFDLVMGVESQLIKIEMALENDVLKGAWFDAEGNSDIVELTLKK
jgi:anti-sigma-K factor RskA